MTGGAGFSRTGENAIRQNKALRAGRRLMKDNPYAASNRNVVNQVEKVPALKNYEQLKQWKYHQERLRKRKRWRIFAFLFFTSLISLLALLILD